MEGIFITRHGLFYQGHQSWDGDLFKATNYSVTMGDAKESARKEIIRDQLWAKRGTEIATVDYDLDRRTWTVLKRERP